MTKVTPQILVTFISIDKKPGKTINAQLYEQLKNGVFCGMLRPGDRMPSSRELATQLTISRNSVMQVFEQLTMEGFFETRTGFGTFVSSGIEKLSYTKKAIDKSEKKPGRVVARGYGLNNAFEGHKSEREAALPFQTSLPLFAEFPFAAWAKISTAVNQKINLLHLGYDDAQGYLPLRKALADHLRISRSINCGAEEILIVNSSRQALSLCGELLLTQGSQCWMEDPGYNGAKSAIRRFGGDICPVPIADDGMDVDYAIRHYPNAKLAYITPSHQYPMGNTMALNERIKLLNYAGEQQMWIIEDDYDSEFRYNGRPIPALQGLDTNGNVIYVGTVSKVLLPALRLGYMVFPTAEMARQFSVAKSATDGQSNIINQAIIAEFISSGHFGRHIRRMRLVYKKAQDDLVELINLHLKGMLTPIPVDAGMHLLAWLPNGVNAQTVAEAAKQEGLIINTLAKYSVRFKHDNGLILGFTGFKLAEMEPALLKLKKVLVKYC
jgi:GntR family transcriptional regulator/MocR family aminotransferase